MSHPTANQKSRIGELDVLRGVAALAVLVSHYTAMYDYHHGFSKRLGFDFKAGSYGVLLFFVISGFVIQMTLHKCRTGTDFLVSRFSRIFPAYWAALLITFSFLHFLKPNGPGIGQLLANFTMLQRFLGVQHLDSVYWTLNVELSFYLWMLLLYRLRWLDRLNLVVPGALLFQLAASLIQRLCGIHFSQGVQVVFLLEYANLFCAGMLFYQAMQKGFNRSTLALLSWCLINHAFTPFRWFPWILHSCWDPLAVLLVFLLMGAVLAGRMSWIVSPVTVFFGTISYPLYLLHDEIGRNVMERLTECGFGNWFGFLAALALAIGLASALTYTVEKPCLRWIRDKYAESKKPRNSEPSPQPIT